MPLDKTFCSSPWFHMRINNTGGYEYCRWATKKDRANLTNIKDQHPIHWFQSGMQHIRKSLLDGEKLPGCVECYQMDQHGKISGRQRQLLKIGVTQEDFAKTMLSSPWMEEFAGTRDSDRTQQLPQDWQIDLGNFCNGACVFCTPYSSSRLAAEFKKLGLIQSVPPNSWCDDPDSLSAFIETLEQSPSLAYLHFIGGETLLTPAFKKILQALVDNGLSTRVSLGFTTNLTVWDQSIVDLLIQFKEINLGLSIECVHDLNDYVRYGGKLNVTMELLERWLALADDHNWLTQLRVTPTVLSIWHLDTIYEYAMEKKLSVESCNFLNEPAFMRPSVLPLDYRSAVLTKLKFWLSKFPEPDPQSVVNSRNPNNTVNQNLSDARSYINYLEHESDESYRLPDLVAYLKKLESSRGNNILDYLPEYEPLLRSAGY